MKVTAIILAGGVGTRLGADVPKQLMPLAGRTVLEHAVAPFEAAESVDRILVVMNPAHIDEAERLLGPSVEVLAGGVFRHDSTHIALQTLDDDDSRVLIHDAARPLVTVEVIERCVAALSDHDAITTAVPVVDTVYRTVGAVGFVDSVIDRTELQRAQTPQGFRLALIRQAHEAAQAAGDMAYTDDCDVVMRFAPGTAVAIVVGDEMNLKITGPHDLAVAEAMLRLRDR